MENKRPRGLRPLSAHIGLAVSSYSGAAPGGAFPGTLETMLRGIQAYYQHPYAPETMNLEILWRQGTVAVKSPGSESEKNAPVILLVPSLINSAKILDLMPERSLLRWLKEQSIDAYLLDWGDVTQDSSQKDLENLVLKRLLPAIEFLSERNDAPIHALGYCMGGTLLTAATAIKPEHIKSLIFLAAPWDFHAGAQALKARVEFWAPSILPVIAEKGALPVDWTQMLFASLDPQSSAEKFAKFAMLDPTSPRAKLFVAVEDWLNDGIDLPGEVAEECMRGWFFENKPAKGEWTLGGAPVNAGSIKCPALIIASSKDRLVEYDSAAALQKSIKNATLINPECGHIGMIAGDQAVHKVWQPIASWLKT